MTSMYVVSSVYYAPPTHLPNPFLKVTRVVFRFFFCIPLFILAIDGVKPHHDINEKA